MLTSIENTCNTRTNEALCKVSERLRQWGPFYSKMARLMDGQLATRAFDKFAIYFNSDVTSIKQQINFVADILLSSLWLFQLRVLRSGVYSVSYLWDHSIYQLYSLEQKKWMLHRYIRYIPCGHSPGLLESQLVLPW